MKTRRAKGKQKKSNRQKKSSHKHSSKGEFGKLKRKKMSEDFDWTDVAALFTQKD